MLRAHRTQDRRPSGRQNKGMKRRILLNELGIVPGSLMTSRGYVRATRPISAGDILTLISIGGNGRCVKLLVLLARGLQASIQFNADVFTSIPLQVLA